MAYTKSMSRRRLIGTSVGLAALGVLACSRAPASSAPSLAATAAAARRQRGVLPPDLPHL